MIRLLSYQDNGYWLATKRLSRGRYQAWPQSEKELCELTAATLRQLLNSVNSAEKHAIGSR